MKKHNMHVLMLYFLTLILLRIGMNDFLLLSESVSDASDLCEQLPRSELKLYKYVRYATLLTM